MANFEAYEQFLKEATTPGPNRTLPGVVVAAVDATGQLSPFHAPFYPPTADILTTRGCAKTKKQYDRNER